ncbi:voltage-gated potassium channel [Myriangium duriaei CBS 260.36]|uniref:Voltage-gated potassium channel n=1 Tax=Myriangium duriaei CBS 260.36 TaxID=1168546 RepID=A0A9P4J504_9PEZI|nr:voltage-gated potassium channel [Myriangium duriaei CBS 260.36]
MAHKHKGPRKRAKNGDRQRQAKSHARGKRLFTVKGALQGANWGATSLFPVHIKTWTEDDDTDWWFAGTAVPLLAATLGPAANVLSIAALVTSWRECLVDNVDPVACPWDGNPQSLVEQLYGHPFADPHWAYYLNVASLVMGFVGNIFLLFNFTGFVRYKIALPVTIIMWYIATAILVAITISVHKYVPPISPQQIFSQGFWYGVMAAALYLLASMLLMLNMVGFFLGHFPEHFNLTDSQRTLILQTMMFFIWLALGGVIFATVETRYGNSPQEWSFVNALYFSDVTILTVGFGDLTCTSSLGRGLVFPYSITGIIMLGLVISSISKFASDLGAAKVVQKHQERSRARTFDRVVNSAEEFASRLGIRRRSSTPGAPGPRQNSTPGSRRNSAPGSRRASSSARGPISAPFDPINTSQITRIPDKNLTSPTKSFASGSTLVRFAAQTTKALTPKPLRKRRSHKTRLLLLREERDRFNTMRRLEMSTTRFKHWMSFVLSTFAFALLWLLGAMVFYYAEHDTQGYTYGDALYFCYVSLLTIGYGDFAPQSNVGRPFFVLWSLIAVPTMTILVSSMGSTVVQGFKTGTERVAEVTVLPRMGLLRDALQRWPFYQRSMEKFQQRRTERKLKQRLRLGFPVGVEESHHGLHLHPTHSTHGPDEPDRPPTPNIETLAQEAADGDHPLSELQLARRLAQAIQRVALDLREHPPRRYCYEEWVEFTQLIRFTNYNSRGREPANRHHHSNGNGASLEKVDTEEPTELIEWDWIGENSPMMAKQTEAEFVLDRLCESMGRYLRNIAVREELREKDTGSGAIGAVSAGLDDNDEEEEEVERNIEDSGSMEDVPPEAERVTKTVSTDSSGVTAVHAE